MAWLEVETKIKVDNLNEIRKKVKRFAKFVKNTKKHDKYFKLNIPEKGEYPKKAFRIRFSGKDYVVNFKKFFKDLSDKHIVVKQEFEWTLRNKEELDNFLQLLEDLGFKEWITKDKTSEIYEHNGAMIELNYVKKLGYFIEIEYLCQRKDVQKAKKTIKNIMKKLDINQDNINNRGYTKMLFDRYKR